jgi:hypothetical protein
MAAPYARRGGNAMKQGDLALLAEPVARQLLQSRISASLAYTWFDGTPRVVPIWFRWDGKQFTLASGDKAPKLRALTQRPAVALTIFEDVWPYKVLMVRGQASIDRMKGTPPEFDDAAHHYLGQEGGDAFLGFYKSHVSGMGRITVTPEWAGLLDFETRMPSVIGG